MIISYYKKAVISGNTVQVSDFDKPVMVGYKRKTKKRLPDDELEDINTNDKQVYLKDKAKRKRPVDEAKKKEYRRRSYYRAKSNIARLINSNFNRYPGYSSKFVTFTFKDNVTDISIANKEWHKFIKRLNRYVGYKVKYVVVIEFQKRGAIHYHCVFFNLPLIPVTDYMAKLWAINSNVNVTLSSLWGNGFVKVNRIDNIKNVGSYVSKYLSKNIDDDRLAGKKTYFCSQGLYKPITVINAEAEYVESCFTLEDLKYKNSYKNEYNTISIRIYNDNSNLYDSYLRKKDNIISKFRNLRC